MKRDSQKMAKVFDLSVAEIERVLSGKCAITDVTKVSSAALATYSRIKSTEVHEMALRLVMEKNGVDIKALNA